MVVLKRLSDAERDGDRILAVIRGSAVNQDGRSSGLTAPNGPAQEAVIREALADARPRRRTTSAPSRRTAPARRWATRSRCRRWVTVFGGRVRADQPLLVGSVKTNIGHLEAAAGIAGLDQGRARAAARRDSAAPALRARPTRTSPGTRSRCGVPTDADPVADRAGAAAPRRRQLVRLQRHQRARHPRGSAGPSQLVARARRPRPQLLRAVGTRQRRAARQQAAQLAACLRRDDPHLDPRRCVHGGHGPLAPRRIDWPWSSTPRAGGRDACWNSCFATGRCPGRRPRARRVRPCARSRRSCSPGQGAQYVGMARELYETEPVYPRRARRAARPSCDPLPSTAAARRDLGADGRQGLLDDTAFTQPALFAVEYALAQLWRSWGVEPAVVMGHSVGEYVAACVAGVFIACRRDAPDRRARPPDERPAARRVHGGRLRRTRGAWRRRCTAPNTDVSIAAVNGPLNTVISGRTAAVDRIVAVAGGRRHRALPA